MIVVALDAVAEAPRQFPHYHCHIGAAPSVRM